jgi:hypothetical protein
MGAFRLHFMVGKMHFALIKKNCPIVFLVDRKKNCVTKKWHLSGFCKHLHLIVFSIMAGKLIQKTINQHEKTYRKLKFEGQLMFRLPLYASNSIFRVFEIP